MVNSLLHPSLGGVLVDVHLTVKLLLWLRNFVVCYAASTEGLRCYTTEAGRESLTVADT